MIVIRFTEEEYEEMKQILQDWIDEGFVVKLSETQLVILSKFGVKEH